MQINPISIFPKQGHKNDDWTRFSNIRKITQLVHPSWWMQEYVFTECLEHFVPNLALMAFPHKRLWCDRGWQQELDSKEKSLNDLWSNIWILMFQTKSLHETHCQCRSIKNLILVLANQIMQLNIIGCTSRKKTLNITSGPTQPHLCKKNMKNFDKRMKIYHAEDHGGPSKKMKDILTKKTTSLWKSLETPTEKSSLEALDNFPHYP